MLRVNAFAEGVTAASAGSLTLSYADRCKCRLRAQLDEGGDEVGLFLPRGTILRGGDLLQSDDGRTIQVLAAAQEVYVVQAQASSTDARLDLLRAAYHLGTRHIPVQILPLRLQLERDPVLKDMLLRLGLQVEEACAPFEPESGAYGGGHRHDHDHDASAGVLGELLSRQAHGQSVPDLSDATFESSN